MKRPPLTEDYIAQAMRDARVFQGNWDCGTSGVLAAHTFRLIKERETHMSRIAELERELAELRAAGCDGLPPQYVGRHMVPAVEPEQPSFDEPIAVSVPLAQTEAAWNGIKARRDAMLQRIREPAPAVIDQVVYERRRPSVIGVTGRAGAGKNLVASMVGVGVVIGLADPLYAALSSLLGIPEVLLRDRSFKERVIPWLGQSPRQLLQTLGTEWGRDSVKPDIWLQLCQRRISMLQENGVACIVVADVRFENEAEMIRSMGGQVWHVRRPEVDQDEPAHSSEAGIEAKDGDVVILNDGTVDDLRHRVFAALYGGKERDNPAR